LFSLDVLSKEIISFFFFFFGLDISLINFVQFVITRFLFIYIKSVFGSVVVGAFQIIFRAKIHVNDVFLFFKNYF